MPTSEPRPLRTELQDLLGTAAHALDPKKSRRIFVNRNLRLDEIQLVGFDMDYTLAIYNQPEIERLSIDATLRKLIAQRGYPDTILGLEYDPTFAVRGLVIDRKFGNILKMDRYGHVGRVYHGHRALSRDERRELYQTERVRVSQQRFACIDTLFSLPEAVMYASLVDFLDRAGPLDYDQLWQDIRESIDEAHRDDTIKRIVKADTATYFVRDPDLGAALHKLRSAGKRLFLLTNSLWDYTDHVMRFLLDGVMPAYASWRSFFDIIVVGSRKPDFFTGRNPFLEIDEAGREIGRPTALSRGHLYQEGNLHDFERLAGASGDGVLYIGDHIYGDMLRSKKSSTWRTAMIIQELEEELSLHERLMPQVVRLEAVERRLPILESEVNYQQVLLKSLQRLENGDGGGGADAAQLEAAKRGARDLLEDLRAQMRETIAEHARLEDQIESSFNRFWGAIFREGAENSRFGEQVEDYACVYTSRVSNFLAYSPLQYFRSPRDHMPHEVS
ncbi:MAG TPA: HAD-IG family 5'-nucleotidase [Polyangia bacterium]